MDFFTTPTILSVATAILAGLIIVAIGLVFEARAFHNEPRLVEETLYTCAAILMFLALITGWLVLKLNVTECQPIPAAVIEHVIKQLDAQAVEPLK